MSQDIILQEGSRDLHHDVEAEQYWEGEPLSTRLEGISIVPGLAGELVTLSTADSYPVVSGSLRRIRPAGRESLPSFPGSCRMCQGKHAGLFLVLIGMSACRHRPVPEASLGSTISLNIALRMHEEYLIR